MPSQSADALIRVASGQVNYRESGGRDGKSGNLTKFGKAYGLDGYAWCSIFVWWCFFQLGIDVRHAVSGSYAGADPAMKGFAKHGWKVTKNPRPGDVVFFHFAGEHAGANHTGIVVSADAGGVHTIEGNTAMPGAKGSQVNGGGVYRRYRPYSVIIGYGRFPFRVPVAAPAKTKPVTGERKYPTLKINMGTAAHPMAQVRRLQALLHVTVNGAFGPSTEKAVRAFQRTHGLLEDGIAGPATLKKLGY